MKSETDAPTSGCRAERDPPHLPGMTVDDHELRRFLEAIYQRYHYDFRQYALGSVLRRVVRAMGHFRIETLAELEARVLADNAVFTELLQFLTVQVTEMFRDPSYFRVFRERIVPTLATYPSIRLWVAGCSSGEEVYSFAIILREEGLLDRTLIYATDINGSALEKAEAGIYPIARIAGYTESHRASGAAGSLSEHYSAAYGSAIFDRSLRARVLFADHSLATDTVFAEMHLVSCRNVLIYFDRPLQERALGVMAEALIRRGFMGLGPRETLRLSGHHERFEGFAEEQRWYRKR